MPLEFETVINFKKCPEFSFKKKDFRAKILKNVSKKK